MVCLTRFCWRGSVNGADRVGSHSARRLQPVADALAQGDIVILFPEESWKPEQRIAASGHSCAVTSNAVDTGDSAHRSWSWQGLTG